MDVSAKLARRVRLLSTGHGRKNDEADSLSVGIAAWSAPAPRPSTGSTPCWSNSSRLACYAALPPTQRPRRCVAHDNVQIWVAQFGRSPSSWSPRCDAWTMPRPSSR